MYAHVPVCVYVCVCVHAFWKSPRQVAVLAMKAKALSKLVWGHRLFKRKRSHTVHVSHVLGLELALFVHDLIEASQRSMKALVISHFVVGERSAGRLRYLPTVQSGSVVVPGLRARPGR